MVTRPRKVCTECKQEIPYGISTGDGKTKCPKCGKIIDIMNCIQWEENKIHELEKVT